MIPRIMVFHGNGAKSVDFRGTPLYFEGVRPGGYSRHPPPALRGPLSRVRRCIRVAFGCGPRFSFPLARLRVAMVRSRRDLYIAPGSRRIRAPRPKLVSQVVHRPAPARAREMFPSSRANGVSPWPAWPAGAVMGRYGPLWATMDRYGPQWAAMGRGAQLLAAVDRSGPLWGALDRSGPLWAAFGRSRPLGPLRPAGKLLWGFSTPLRALVAAPGRRAR